MTTAHSGSGDLSHSLELLWQGREPAARGPKPGLSLQYIVEAAVELADREGLAALSMRRVAAELEVGTMSLYRYVPGKGELLDLMLDHVNGLPDEPPDPTSSHWRTLLESIARGTWQLYLDHPWLLQVNQARPLLGPKALASFDFALCALDGLGLTGQEKVEVIMALDHYVTGTARTFVLQQQAAQQSGVSDEKFWAAQLPLLERAMASGDYPQLAQLPDDAFSIGGEAALEFGLQPLLDGLENLIAAAGQPPHTNPAQHP